MSSRLPIRIKTIVYALATLLRRRRRPVAAPRILIAHYLLLGDTILLAPLLKKLRATHPQAEITVLSRPAFLPIFEKKPYGVKALAFDRRDPASQAGVLRSGPYDLAVVPDDNRYAWLARAAGAAWVIGFADDKPSWKNWMIDEAVPYPIPSLVPSPAATPPLPSTTDQGSEPQPGAWADMASGLVPGADPEPYQAGEWPSPTASDFEFPQMEYAVLHVGASTPLKLWPAERWRALADRIHAGGLAIVWSGGKGEGAILDAIGVRPGEIDMIGKLDLGQLWAQLARARLLVCPDTGIAHLARVIGVPTIALFGPGSAVIHGAGRFWRDAPFQVVTEPDFPCRDQRVLFRRELDWVRRCGRSFGGTQVAAATQCADPLCMKAIRLAEVEQRLSRVRIAEEVAASNSGA